MIGVFIWNKFRTERDIVTNKARRVRNPRSEWIVQYDKDLAVFGVVGLQHLSVWLACEKEGRKARGIPQ